MAAQTWNSLQATCLATTVKAQAPYTTAPLDFATLFPQATSYAEERIFTDIPLLGNRTSNTSLTTGAGVNIIDMTAMVNALGGPIIVPESLYLVTSGGKVPFLRSSTFVINAVWPNPGLTAAPSVASFQYNCWAMQDDHNIIIAPTPDSSYPVEIAGLYQPTPISATNQTTYLSTVYPALLEAACMVFLSGWLLHNYGSKADNPQQAMSFEADYQALMTGAKAEEARRRGLTPDIPMPSKGG